MRIIQSSTKKGGCMKAKFERMVFAIALIFLVFLTTSGWAADVKPIVEFNHASSFAPSSITGRMAVEWLDEVFKATGGKVKGNFFAGGALGKGPEILGFVKAGTAGSGTTGVGWTKDFAVLDFLELPYQVPGVVVGSNVAYELYKRGYLDKDLKGTKLMFMFASEPFHIFTTKKKITSMDDLKGLKIRASGAGTAMTLKAWGATPVTIAPPDLYMALEKGTIDGVMAGWGLVEGAKLHELTKYVLWEPLGIGVLINIMNDDIWNKIPPDLQKIIQNVNAAMAKRSTEDMNAMNKTGEDFLRKNKVEVTYLSSAEKVKWQKMADDVRIPAMKSAWKSLGLQADDLMKECLAMAEQYKQQAK
jgi:TRAP-type C4-dicarboxylate transport system substrate-binding protein